MLKETSQEVLLKGESIKWNNGHSYFLIYRRHIDNDGLILSQEGYNLAYDVV